MTDSVDLRTAERGSPEWWLRYLLHKLEARRFDLERWDRYYVGNHPLSFLDDQIRDAFGERFRRFSSNFAALVVDAFAERLEVQGFRFKDPKGDKDLWNIWQENDLDSGSQIAHTEALIKGEAYVLVEPRLDDGTPRITVEDPLDCIVESRDTPDPGGRLRRRRVAGLKRWVDDEGHLVVYVYLPTVVCRYRSVQKWPDRIEGWPAASMMGDTYMEVPAGGFEQFATEAGEWPIQNSLGVVPLVPLPNRPRVKGMGRSEIEPIASNQDAINYFRVAAVVGGRYLAYPQRWVRNLEVEIDPETGAPKPPFKAGMANLWTVPPYAPEDPRGLASHHQTEFGQFLAGDLAPFLKMIESEVGQMAAISRLPLTSLLGSSYTLPPSGESNNSSEAFFIRKAGRTEIHFGEGWEEMMRVALLAMHDERADIRTAETIWADAETRNLAVMTDAIIKQWDAGIIDDETAQEKLGYSPEQIERMRTRREARLPRASQPVPRALDTTSIGAGFIEANRAISG